MIKSILKAPKKVLNKQDIVAAVVIGICVVFFLLRAPFGFNLDDESWYTTFAHRVFLGDSLFTHDWNVAQLIGFILYLPVRLFISITGSTQGITLTFRYLFILFQTFVTVFAYWRLRRYGYISIWACVVFFLHVSWFVMALYYNTMGVGFVLISGLTLATADKMNKFACFFLGVCFALAVLCNPPLALAYFILSIFLFIRHRSEKLKELTGYLPDEVFSGKAWFRSTWGIMLTALVLLLFVFSRTDLYNFLLNLPHLFTDPEYAFTLDSSAVSRVFQPLNTFKEFINLSKPLFYISLVLFVRIISDKRRLLNRHIYLSLTTGVALAYMIVILKAVHPFTYMLWMFPILIPGLTAYILSEKRDIRLFVFVWCFGVFYAACLDFTSEVGAIGAANGFAVADVASVLFLGNVFNEMRAQNLLNKKKNHRRSLQTFIAAACVSIILLLGAQTSQQIFMMASPKLAGGEFFNSETKNKDVGFNVKLTAGPQKGLRTTPAIAKVYNGVLLDLDKIKAGPDGPVLITENWSWFYLYLQRPYGTYSTWFPTSNPQYFYKRLDEYYALHEDKLPVHVYIPKFIGTSWGSELDEYIKPGNEVRSEEILKEIKKILNTYNRTCTVEHSDFGIIVHVREKV
jgi:hypothetical protein